MAGSVNPLSMEISFKSKNIQFLTKHNAKEINKQETVRSFEVKIAGGENHVTFIRFGHGKEASLSDAKTFIGVSEEEMEL